jgi:ubiquitin C-terminal hydrolase
MLGHTHRDCNDIDQCVVCALQLFTQEYWNPPPAQAGLTNQNFLFSALRTQIPATGQGISSIHSDTTQGDSHEFLQYLVEQVIAKTTPGTFCDRVFRYAQRSTWTCVTCTKVHTRPSVVQNALRPITIQFPRTGLSFKEYLRLSFQNSVPLQCDGAQCVAQRAQNPNYQNPTQTEHFEIEKEPEVLIFQLVRMTLTPNGTTRKIANQVPFEEYLNMGPYIAEQGGERRDVMYRLDGVVAHAGPNLTSGHYIAGVRDADGKKFSLINDQVVSARDVGALERPYWSSNFEPYILIYSKL